MCWEGGEGCQGEEGPGATQEVRCEYILCSHTSPLLHPPSALLSSPPQATYDLDHALVLVQLHNFSAGILYLYEKAEL